MGLFDTLFGPLVGLAGDVFGADRASSASRQANRTNIQLAREQREWEKELANTSIQRRVADYKAAGLNPVLAAGGPGAGTPSVSAPTVEPTFRQEWTKGSAAQAALMREQILNIRANTADQAAAARLKNVDADIAEATRGQKLDWTANKYLEEREQQDLRTQIMRSMDIQSAAEAKKAQDTVDNMVKLIAQQAETGAIDLAALRNVAEIGGVEANKVNSIMKTVLDFIRVMNAKD